MPRTPNPDLDYIRKLYAPQDALLSRIDRTLKEMGSSMHIGPEEGKLLQLLIGLHGVKSIVEIGTFAGYSAIWMARALPENGRVYTIDRDAKHLALAREFFAEAADARITQLKGEAWEVLKTIEDKGPFDMVFIDADKNNYNAYLDWAERNVRQGGLIVADNTLLFGTAAIDTPPEGASARVAWEGMRLFNQRLADPNDYFTTMIPTQEGLTVAVKLF